MAEALQPSTTRVLTYDEVIKVLASASLDSGDIENLISFLSTGGSGVWREKGKEDPLILKQKIKHLTTSLAEARAEKEQAKKENSALTKNLADTRQRLSDFKSLVGKQLEMQSAQINELKRGREYVHVTRSPIPSPACEPLA